MSQKIYIAGIIGLLVVISAGIFYLTKNKKISLNLSSAALQTQ